MYLRTGILLLALFIILSLLGMGYLISNAYFKAEGIPRSVDIETRKATDIPETSTSVLPDP